MTHSAVDNTVAKAQFAVLIEALSHRVGATLDPSDGMVALADGRQSVRLIVEMAAQNSTRCYAIVPFADVPEDTAEAGTLAGQLLILNADREALGGASLCADAQRGKFCLIKACDLTMDPVAFIETVESLGDLGERIAALLNEGEGVTPTADTLMAGLGMRV